MADFDILSVFSERKAKQITRVVTLHSVRAKEVGRQATVAAASVESSASANATPVKEFQVVFLELLYASEKGKFRFGKTFL